MSIDFDLARESMNSKASFPEAVLPSLRNRFPELGFLFDELDDLRDAKLNDGIERDREVEALEDKIADLEAEISDLKWELDKAS